LAINSNGFCCFFLVNLFLLYSQKLYFNCNKIGLKFGTQPETLAPFASFLAMRVSVSCLVVMQMPFFFINVIFISVLSAYFDFNMAKNKLIETIFTDLFTKKIN